MQFALLSRRVSCLHGSLDSSEFRNRMCGRRWRAIQQGELLRRRRTAKKEHEIATRHSITSSAHRD
jgi:hypothetical protein